MKRKLKVVPGRKVILATGEYYHLFNRGSEKRTIFSGSRDFSNFIKRMYYYQFIGPKLSFSKLNQKQFNTFSPIDTDKLVEIISYCLMPNHFHLLVRQLKESGSSVFISQLCNSYTKYFNTKYNRVGPLFQGAFKAVRVESDQQLVHLSRYIHLNPVVAGLVTHPDYYPWSSFPEFMNTPIICSTNEILGFFVSKESYKRFMEDQIEYGTTLEQLKHLVLEEI